MSKRLSLFLALPVLALAAAPATAATTNIDVPEKGKRAIASAKKGPVDVFVPETFKVDNKFVRRVVFRGGRTRSGYSISIEIGRDCGGANACTLGYMSADRGDELPRRPNATVGDNIAAYYKPLTCGGSCSPPSISWVFDNAVYTIQAQQGRTKSQSKRALIALADQALTAGPR